MIICHCKSINNKHIIECINSGFVTVRDIVKKTGAGTICGNCKCKSVIKKVIETQIKSK